MNLLIRMKNSNYYLGKLFKSNIVFFKLRNRELLLLIMLNILSVDFFIGISIIVIRWFLFMTGDPETILLCIAFCVEGNWSVLALSLLCILVLLFEFLNFCLVTTQASVWFKEVKNFCVQFNYFMWQCFSIYSLITMFSFFSRISIKRQRKRHWYLN